jgi:hypothetical protein
VDRYLFSLDLIFSKSRNAKLDLDCVMVGICLMASTILATFLESGWMGGQLEEIDGSCLRSKDFPDLNDYLHSYKIGSLNCRCGKLWS